MKTGTLNRNITIYTLTETVTAGRVEESYTSATVRAKVTQVDGSRFLKDDELTDRAVYKFELWDNSYSDKIKIVYDGLTLFPIRPITRNPGNSNLNEITILAATKK